MNEPAAKQPLTNTERTALRRQRMRAKGWIKVDAELSPTCARMLTMLIADSGESRSQLIERAIMALPDCERAALRWRAPDQKRS